MDRGAILLVRHGKGRGRLRRYMHEAVSFMRSNRPEVFSRLLLHATGSPRPCLDGVRAVVFWLGDPLREWYPACYCEAADLAAEARARGIPVINPPERLSNTVKSVQANLWREAAIPTPPTYRFESPQQLQAIVDRVGFPLLIRGDEHHSQTGMQVCRSKADMEDQERRPYPGVVSPLVDTRASFREIDPHSVWARYHHKKRILVLGERLRTKHVMFSRDPVVSGKTYSLRRYKLASRLGWNPSLPPDDLACVQADLDYWRQGSEHDRLMRRAVAVLGLQFAAIDYSSLADGSVVLWEANAYFRLPKKRNILLPRRRRARQRLASYYGAIADFLADLAVGGEESATSGPARSRPAA